MTMAASVEVGNAVALENRGSVSAPGYLVQGERSPRLITRR